MPGDEVLVHPAAHHQVERGILGAQVQRQGHCPVIVVPDFGKDNRARYTVKRRAEILHGPGRPPVPFSQLSPTCSFEVECPRGPVFACEGQSAELLLPGEQAYGAEPYGRLDRASVGRCSTCTVRR